MDFDAIKATVGKRVFSAVVRSLLAAGQERTRSDVVAVVLREAGEDSELKADQAKRRFVCDWIMSQLGYGGGI